MAVGEGVALVEGVRVAVGEGVAVGGVGVAVVEGEHPIIEVLIWECLSWSDCCNQIY